MTDRSDAKIVRWNEGMRTFRWRFEPQSDGGYERIQEEWTGCKWRTMGSVIVEDVAFEAGDITA